MSKLPVPSSLALPDLPPEVGKIVGEILSIFKLPPSVLASSDQIEAVWKQLPRALSKVPEPHRREPLARMCVASVVGLFDACVNYTWNISVEALRDRIRTFGFHIVAQIKKEDFDEKKLIRHKIGRAHV